MTDSVPEKGADSVSPQGLGSLLEDSLEALVRPGTLFGKRASAPTPAVSLLAANFSCFGLGAALIGGVLASVAGAASLPSSPMGWMFAVSLFLAAVLAAGIGGTILTHVAALLSGGSGNLPRSFQIVSLSAPIFFLGLAAHQAPHLWPVPVLWWAFLAGQGIRLLHGTPAARTWAATAVVASLGLWTQWSARRNLDSMAQNAASLGPRGEQLRALADLLEMAARSNPAGSPGREAGLPSGEAPPYFPRTPETAGPGSPAPSGLDLIGSPGTLPSDTPASPEMEQVKAIQKTTGDLMARTIPMVNNPELLKLLPPPQAKMMKDLAQILAQAQGQIQGKPMTPQQQQEAYLKMMELQKLFMQMNPGSKQQPPPAGPAAPQKDRKP